jgi:beta-glucosidase
VPRLGVAEFSTGCEGIHGAAWDPDLARQVGLATGREVRALHDDHPLISLNVWVPAVNLLRDPRRPRLRRRLDRDGLGRRH